MANKDVKPDQSSSKQLNRLSTADTPLVFRNHEQQVLAGIKLEDVSYSAGNLRLIGWCVGFQQPKLICDGEELPAVISTVARPDVSDNYRVDPDVEPGFDVLVMNAQPGNYGLRVVLSGKNEPKSFDFQLELGIPELQSKHVGSAPQTKPRMNSSQIQSPQGVAHCIECILALADGVAVVGWVDDRLREQPVIHLVLPNGRQAQFPFKDGEKGCRLFRIFRPDVAKALGDSGNARWLVGFVAWFPIDVKGCKEAAVAFGDTTASIRAIPITRPEVDAGRLAALQIHSGPDLRVLAEEKDDVALLTSLDDIDAESLEKQSASKLLSVNQALLVLNRAILITGWIGVPSSELQQVEIVAGATRFDITAKIVRSHQPELHSILPWSKAQPAGFLALIESPELVGFSTMTLVVRTKTAGVRALRFSPEMADWSTLLVFLNSQKEQALPALALLSSNSALQTLPRFSERLADLNRANFLHRLHKLPDFVEQPQFGLVAIDRVFALGEVGMVLFGWHFEPANRVCRVTVHGPEGQACDITDKLFPLYRLDVSQNLGKRFPDINDDTGFVCLAPLPTQPGEPRAICFATENGQSVWLKLVSAPSESQGVALIKEILGVIPAPDKIRASLYHLFDQGLGKAITAVDSASHKSVEKVEERQFGQPPAAPIVSVIVPLYGRYDFIRHQLAQFVDDPDFDQADLIYVVDDPAIVVPALDMAAAHHELFRKPFRVAWYGKNLGFSGANNVGARLARAEYLLLLNSDVIPREPGWLTILRSALERLPNAGAVGPLLQFADDSVQHAGMQPKRDPFLPGFLLNTHPGKGRPWCGGDEPFRSPLLTAACLMLRTADYLGMGGLDEHYVIGDFEDSDLCLALRKTGKSLWVVPSAKLWHLERQSQNLENISGYRQLVTLYNGWRYQQKIIHGEIANPELSEL